MSACASCLGRALKNLASDGQISSVGRTSIRTHATIASLKTAHHRSEAAKYITGSKKDAPIKPNTRRKAPGRITKAEQKDAQARLSNRETYRRTAQSYDVEQDDDDDDTAAVDENKGAVRPSELSDKQEVMVAEARNAKELERKALQKARREVETYYQDPLRLANAVADHLRVPNFEAAIALVRASETFNIANIVSWNHCMDWLMSQGEVNKAIKVYNEMKKRGHRPDAYTYTIMLRGLSRNVNKPQAVKEAVKIYNSIFAPNSAVKASIIHTNAIINVCARGGDMESLWAVVAKLPESGNGSPDGRTYTIILNAIRDDTIKKAMKTSDRVTFQGDADAADKARAQIFDQALADGHKLWQDIMRRWKNGTVDIDEHLVCAMGRLITGCGKSQQLEQVLDLVEATMNLRIPERRITKTSDHALLDTTLGDSRVEPTFATQTPEGKPAPQPATTVVGRYVQPTSKTLSLMLEALSLHKPLQHLARPYWFTLTRPDGEYRVQPDADNILTLLRILRHQRASTFVYELLNQDWPDHVLKTLYREATFVLAFSTCLRDKLNPNVFDTATKLLELYRRTMGQRELAALDEDTKLSEMKYPERKKALAKKKKQEAESGDVEHSSRRVDMPKLDIDPRILNYFLELAMKTTRGWNEGIRGVDDGTKFERDPKKNHTMVALTLCEDQAVQLRRQLKVQLQEAQFEVRSGRSGKDAPGGPSAGENVRYLIDLMRTMISAYDKVEDIGARFARSRDIQDKLDPAMLEEYHNNKRQYTALAARSAEVIEQQAAKTSLSPKRRQTLNEDDAEEDDEEDRRPAIEKNMKGILRDVDTTLIERTRQNRFNKTKRKGFAEVVLNEPRVRIHSRRQGRERDNMIDAKMKKAFGRTDHGVLDDNLELRGAKFTQGYRALRLETDTSGREPQIGDELNLDDTASDKPIQDEVRQELEKQLELQRLKVQRDKLYAPFSHEVSSINRHNRVREGWQRAKARAAA